MALDVMSMYESIVQTVQTYKKAYADVPVPDDLPEDMAAMLNRDADSAFDVPAKDMVLMFRVAVAEATTLTDDEREMGMEMSEDLRDLMIAWTVLRILSTVNNQEGDALLGSIEDTFHAGMISEETAAVAEGGVGAFIDKMEWRMAAFAKALFDDFLAK